MVLTGSAYCSRSSKRWSKDAISVFTFGLVIIGGLQLLLFYVQLKTHAQKLGSSRASHQSRWRCRRRSNHEFLATHRPLESRKGQQAMSLRTSKDNRIPVLELPFQQAASAQLSGTSRSNDLHNHSRHTARTNTNTSAATMIQINAGSFSYMAAGQYAAIGRCLWKCERPRQEVEPAPGPRCPTSTLGGPGRAQW